VVLFFLLALFRKSLFVDPVVQSIIQRSREEEEEGATSYKPQAASDEL
jgi:hypothetical protein